MNPIAVIDQDDMVADHNVAIMSRRRSQGYVQVMRQRPDACAHIGREHETFPDIRLPFIVPIAPLVMPESMGMIVVPIARNLAIVVVEMIVTVLPLCARRADEQTERQD